MRLSRLNLALYVGLIFASGITVGVFAHRLYTVNTVAAKATHSPEEFRKHFVSDLQTRLNLRPDQVQKVNVILDGTRARFQEVHDKYRPEMNAIREQQHANIREILDDTQKAEFEKIKAERDKRMSRRGAGSGF